MKQTNYRQSQTVNQVEIEFTRKPITPWGGIASIVVKFLETIKFDVFVKDPICSLFVIPAPYQVRDKLQNPVILGCYGLPLPDQVEDRFRGSDSI